MKTVARRRSHRPSLGWARRRATATARDAGAVSLEAALMMVGLILPLWLGCASVMQMYHGQNLAEAAAQAGIDAARSYTNPADGAAAARAYITQVNPGIYKTLDVSGSRGADTVTVTIHATSAGFFGIPLPAIDASASAPVERITQ